MTHKERKCARVQKMTKEEANGNDMVMTRHKKNG